MKIKKNYLIIFLMLLCINSYAQDIIVLNVTYEFNYVRDLENKKDAYKTNMILSLGKSSSRYCSEKLYNEHDQSKSLKQEHQQTPSKAATVVSGGPLLVIGNQGAIINEEIMKDITSQQLVINAHMGFKSYKIETVQPKINWEIQNDKKVIGGYTCQKATGSYGGRTYDAWFSPDLPFQDGPWKLSGLPGLILEANDRTNEISFVFKELSRNSDPGETTKSYLASQYSIKTNLKSYKQAKSAFETDPEAIMSAWAPNARLAIKNIDDPNSQSVRKIKKYNAMELD